ncbi:MAG: patatin-like phospholipase family protein [Saprospiraceae bacterium]|jgi:patatin-like phospholipase/acyl hydrolase|nr:patatin-like phospholipase family protein [Saprospiraceae bacterium]
MKTLHDHLHQDPNSPQPKRILALDGGGIRGALTLGILKSVEDILRERHGGSPDFRLCDYFDLIGGTSTGSIIATLLAIGKNVDEIQEMYQNLGTRVFGKSRMLALLRAGKFDVSELEKLLEEQLGQETIGGKSIRTGLCIVAKRADTGGTWAFFNHPGGKYFEANKGILLRNAVRASSAAPTYFDAEAFDVGNGEIGAFVDGGVSMHNNPAMLLFLMATTKGFPFHWKTGDELLELVSVGTGYAKNRRQVDECVGIAGVKWAPVVPAMLMDDADNHNQLLLQYMSKSPTARQINSEFGDLAEDNLCSKPLFHYLRYDVKLEQNVLNDLGFTKVVAEKIREMSDVKNKEVLRDIGLAAGRVLVEDDHFPPVFNV